MTDRLNKTIPTSDFFSFKNCKIEYELYKNKYNKISRVGICDFQEDLTQIKEINNNYIKTCINSANTTEKILEVRNINYNKDINQYYQNNTLATISADVLLPNTDANVYFYKLGIPFFYTNELTIFIKELNCSNTVNLIKQALFATCTTETNKAKMYLTFNPDDNGATTGGNVVLEFGISKDANNYNIIFTDALNTAKVKNITINIAIKIKLNRDSFKFDYYIFNSLTGELICNYNQGSGASIVTANTIATNIASLYNIFSDYLGFIKRSVQTNCTSIDSIFLIPQTLTYETKNEELGPYIQNNLKDDFMNKKIAGVLVNLGVENSEVSSNVNNYNLIYNEPAYNIIDVTTSTKDEKLIIKEKELNINLLVNSDITSKITSGFPIKDLTTTILTYIKVLTTYDLNNAKYNYTYYKINGKFRHIEAVKNVAAPTVDYLTYIWPDYATTILFETEYNYPSATLTQLDFINNPSITNNNNGYTLSFDNLVQSDKSLLINTLKDSRFNLYLKQQVGDLLITIYFIDCKLTTSNINVSSEFMQNLSITYQKQRVIIN